MHERLSDVQARTRLCFVWGALHREVTGSLPNDMVERRPLDYTLLIVASLLISDDHSRTDTYRRLYGIPITYLGVERYTGSTELLGHFNKGGHHDK